jgi:hypothetical protein
MNVESLAAVSLCLILRQIDLVDVIGINPMTSSTP